MFIRVYKYIFDNLRRHFREIRRKFEKLAYTLLSINLIGNDVPYGWHDVDVVLLGRHALDHQKYRLESCS